MHNKHVKTWIFYFVMISSFIILTYVLFKNAEKFNEYVPPDVTVVSSAVTDNFDSFKLSISHNLGEPVALLLMQIIAILFVSRIAGWFFIKIGQPTVIGEILAGILL